MKNSVYLFQEIFSLRRIKTTIQISHREKPVYSLFNTKIRRSANSFKYYSQKTLSVGLFFPFSKA